MYVHIYIFKDLQKLELFPFVKAPLALLEKWPFHLAVQQPFFLHTKVNEVGFGRWDEESSSSHPCRTGRITYVLEVRYLANSIWLLVHTSRSW